MKTGEGKTLTSTLPTYLNGLSGKGVHIVTVNDYLATRDADWMGKVHRYMGLSVGAIHHGMREKARQEAYAADITYGQNNEFGFDYLRDNMKASLEDYVQRKHNFAIVDEVDSILIDEARTPLIISGPSEQSTEIYYKMNGLIPKLTKDSHFTVDEKSKKALLTEDGISHIENLLGISNLYDPTNIEVVHSITQALCAHHLYVPDVDYVVKDGEVIIVDEFTGRLMPGRRWSDGLHQAIEAKENVNIEGENQTLASITFQNYFRMYEKLAGMTGTADTEAEEFKRIYGLDVVVVPTNRPLQRLDHPDVVFKNDAGKTRAIIREIQDCHEKGQPVLVGTISIEKSEQLARELKKSRIPHHVLNAKQHDKEAEIVARAGKKGAVTIATNMAGRGTDIVLGGNFEFMAKTEAAKKEIEDDINNPEYLNLLEKYQVECKDEQREVLEAGGLHIIGTERHESRRIDNQLRGRSGRQGDPGSSRFYLSLEDDLMRIFGAERIQKVMNTLGMEEDEPIEHNLVSRSIENAQKKVEGHNYDIRKHLLEYDDVMNQQRNVVYTLRRNILEGNNIAETVSIMREEICEDIAQTFFIPRTPTSQWDWEAINNGLMAAFNTDRKIAPENLQGKEADHLYEALLDVANSEYERKEKEFGKELMEELEKDYFIQVLDHLWKDHLLQIRPITEEELEAQRQMMREAEEGEMEFQHADTENLAKQKLEETRKKRQQAQQQQMQMSHGAPDEPMDTTTVKRSGKKVGRNDPCPCGSGKKYKKCHGK
jgi:preprotein translocase subunit SecA